MSYCFARLQSRGGKIWTAVSSHILLSRSCLPDINIRDIYTLYNVLEQVCMFPLKSKIKYKDGVKHETCVVPFKENLQFQINANLMLDIYETTGTVV